MSLVKLANTCAHIQNCSRVRIPLISIPYTGLHLQFAYNLYKNGFVSSIQKGSTKSPDDSIVDVTPDNIATRRIWMNLKYKENKPIISSCRLISKPNLRISLTYQEMQQLSAGKSIRLIKPLQPGELILIRTKDPNTKKDVLMDINEAIDKRLNGEVLCRVN
ncbi:hypothetical protein TPHA_0C03730 [Tetrapisispora phaffii CBS 4417]|uniref:Ribosomal protein S8 n=1 Tax=Tetrapisispora phaffii (strain ATCC 24235 / CBS 4417 / NBRC 1672 / NRRL Y-8282 / UCD 70-5) TaxID=1071381 RepID=G8BQL3_TETPH|nr:mitochondrial 37S ribosomal protein MRPS8 TPHA_0C03730 [Tetrapisispora phaffii CBS 4417]CCE62525.1 hypothetical protein TPHA_0C03730 [Tetrapisispora phaffii CBS 4417]